MVGPTATHATRAMRWPWRAGCLWDIAKALERPEWGAKRKGRGRPRPNPGLYEVDKPLAACCGNAGQASMAVARAASTLANLQFGNVAADLRYGPAWSVSVARSERD